MAWTESYLGSGSGSTMTILYDNNDAIEPFAANTTLVLLDDVTKYDCIIIYTAYNERGRSPYYNTHFGNAVIYKESIAQSILHANDGYTYSGYVDINGSFASASYCMSWAAVFTDNTHIISKDKATGGWSAGQCGIYKIIGVKF